MKIDEQIVLAAQTNRLQAAGQAAQALQASLQEKEQAFDLAGCRFGGFDATHIKSALVQALTKIADDAVAHLKKGGVEFPDPPPVNRAERRKASAKAGKKPGK